MAYTQDQLTTLETAYSQGITSMQHNGRRVEYRSLEEMKRLIDSMRSELGVSTSRSSRSRVINVLGGKGL